MAHVFDGSLPWIVEVMIIGGAATGISAVPFLLPHPQGCFG